MSDCSRECRMLTPAQLAADEIRRERNRLRRVEAMTPEQRAVYESRRARIGRARIEQARILLDSEPDAS